MALQPLPPIPNTRLVDAPDRDAIWRRYLEQLFNRIIPLVNVHNDLTGLQGGTTNEYYHLTQAQHSTVTSFGTFTNNRVLVTGPTSSITTSDDLAYTIATSTLTAINISTRGTLTVGDASGDTLTVNAGTWTYGANWAATRAAGALGASTQNIERDIVTATADAGGTTNARAKMIDVTYSGANTFAQGYAQVAQLVISGAANHTAFTSTADSFGYAGTGTLTIYRGHSSFLSVTNSGGVTNAHHYDALSPTLSSTGAITTLKGYNVNDLGHATLVTSALGFDAANFTAGPTFSVAFRSQQNSGTGKWGFYASGTANNAFAGNVRIGSVVAPTVALDVTGSANISSTAGIGNTAVSTSALTLAAATTGLSSLNAPHGTAPSAPVNGDIWTTTSGIFVRINGGTVGPLTSNTGTVTSVAQTFTGGLISVSGSPITTSGTLALTVAGTSGGIPYFSSGTAWASSAALAANALVIGGGAGAAPATTTTGTGVITALGVNVGTAGAFVVNGGALGTPSSGTVTNLTGTASININGTVGATTPATGTFTDLTANGNTTLGDAAADTLTINAETVSQPNIPCFLAYNSADDTNATGNGTVATVDFDTEVFDQSGDFASDTFTASVAGKYEFQTAVRVSAIPAGCTSCVVQLLTSNRSLEVGREAFVAGTWTVKHVCLACTTDLDAGDTAIVRVQFSGGAGNTATIEGSASPYTTWFSGKLAA